MRSSYFLYIFCVLLLLCSSVQVVSAEGDSSYEQSWNINTQFNNAQGIAVDRVGSVYVADTDNNRILKFTSDGALLASLGNGQLTTPHGVAVDISGNVYVADTGGNRIQKFAPTGDLTASWGTQGSEEKQFASPTDVAVDNAGNVYVVDSGNYRIQKFTSTGTFLKKWGSRGFLYEKKFNFPIGIAIDSSGDVYVADSTTSMPITVDDPYTPGKMITSHLPAGGGAILKFTSDGTYLSMWEDLNFCHYEDGRYFDGPTGITVDEGDNVYGCGYFVSKFSKEGKKIGSYYPEPWAIDAAVDNKGNIYFLINRDGTSWVEKESPTGEHISDFGKADSRYIGVDGTGNVYAFDSAQMKIVKFTSTGTYLTSWGGYGSGNGQFKDPHGIAVDRAGNVYVADTGNSRVQKFTSDGNFTLQWFGTVFKNVSGFDGPYGITVDNYGYVYVANWDGYMLKFTSNGFPVTSIYHNRQYGIDYDIAVDNAGTIYLLGTYSPFLLTLTQSGEIYNWVHDPCSWSNTGAAYRCTGITTDAAGNIYVRASMWAGGPSFINIFSSDGHRIASTGGQGGVDWLDWGGRDVAADNAGNVYMVSGTAIQKYTTPNSSIHDFTATPISGSAPLTVHFRDTSTAHCDKWEWDFDNDGRVDSTLRDPTFTFSNPGIYTVNLTRFHSQLHSSSYDVVSSITKTNYIYVNNISVESVSVDTAVSTVNDVGISVRGKGFLSGTSFQLVNTTLGTISCKPSSLTRVSGNELRGNLSFADAKEGLYDIVVTTPSGTTARLDKGFRVLPVPVVLIYGWHGAPGAWDVLRPALSKEGIDYWDFDYNTSIDPTVSANTLSDFIQKKRLTYKRDLYPNGYTGKIDIVCHSMGAIVSRWYMEQKGHGNEIRQWIGIAPAHGGSAGADSQSFQNEGSDDSTTTGWQYLICSIFGDSTRYLQTNSGAEQILKYDQISPSTTYRVIAGWNPHHDVQFGYGALYRTRALAPNGSYYWTFNGDMIVAAAQSYHKGMGFDCFPILNEGEEGGNDEPGCNFSHVHIHHSPAVINRVIKYLENPQLPKDENMPVDPNENEPYYISVIKTVADRIQTWQINYVIEHPFVIPFILKYGDSSAMPGSGTTVTDELLVDLNWTEGSLSLELTAPDGQKFTSTTNTATAWSMSDSNHVLFTIVSPAAGNWSAKIIPVSLPDHAIEYNLTMYRSTVNGILEGPTPTVSPIKSVPGVTGTPTSTKHNSKYDDVNGNGVLDFNDVVLYFNQMDWIAENEPVPAFDFNKNGKIDFNDIVMLFNEM